MDQAHFWQLFLIEKALLYNVLGRGLFRNRIGLFVFLRLLRLDQMALGLVGRVHVGLGLAGIGSLGLLSTRLSRSVASFLTYLAYIFIDLNRSLGILSLAGIFKEVSKVRKCKWLRLEETFSIQKWLPNSKKTNWS